MKSGTSALRALIVSMSMAIFVSGCWGFKTPQNTVVTGNLAYFYFKELATNDIVDTLHYGLNQGDARATLAFMAGMAKSEVIKSRLKTVGFLLADFDYFFHSDNDGDFATAANDTHEFSFCSTGSDPRSTSSGSIRAACPNNRCLVMHRNLNPLGDRHNWTYRETHDRYCTNGRGYV